MYFCILKALYKQFLLIFTFKAYLLLRKWSVSYAHTFSHVIYDLILSSNLFKVGVYLGEVAFAQVPDLFLLLLGHDLTPVLEVVLVEDLKWYNKDG